MEEDRITVFTMEDGAMKLELIQEIRGQKISVR